MNELYKLEGKYNTSPNEIDINKSKLKTTFKPMIVLDKNRNFYMCVCKKNFVVEGSKYSTINIFQKTKQVKKYILTKRI